MLILLYYIILITGGKDTDCTTGNIIGRNTGVYIGGLPDDYILQRVES